MTKSKNKFGLSRNIPEEVAKQVRKRCGFGCVICGDAFYQYEHFSPEFKDAKNHDPAGITLLCAYCHDRKTRGGISLEAVREANLIPKAITQGFADGPLEFGREGSKIQIGSAVFKNSKSIVTIDDESLFVLDPPEDDTGPFLLTFIPQGKNGTKIIKNQWFGSPKEWDITTKANRIVVRSSNRILLDLENCLNDRFVVRHIDIEQGSIHLLTTKIRKKKFKMATVPKHTAFRILNSSKREISRITDRELSNNETIFEWDYALRVENDFMSPNILGLDVSGADFYYAIPPDAPIKMIGSTISNSTFTIGSSEQVASFVEFVNKEPHWDWSPEKNQEFRHRMKYLRHMHFLAQLPSESMQILQRIETDIKMKYRG